MWKVYRHTGDFGEGGGGRSRERERLGSDEVSILTFAGLASHSGEDCP